jgi:hypothetical protein
MIERPFTTIAGDRIHILKAAASRKTQSVGKSVWMSACAVTRTRWQQRVLRFFASRASRRLMAGCAVLVGGWANASDDDSSRNTALKAAVLYNFVHFTEWPEGSFADARAPLVIGIFGEDPFGKTLDALVARERFGSHPLTVERYHDFAAVSHAHILFFSVSERERAKELLAGIKGKPILTVSDFDGFIRCGGMVLMHEFVGERIQIRVNLAEIRSARLTLSGKLLRVAESITPEQD